MKIGDRVEVSGNTGLKDPRYRNGWRGSIIGFAKSVNYPWNDDIIIRPDADPGGSFTISRYRVRVVSLLELIAEAARDYTD